MSKAESNQSLNKQIEKVIQDFTNALTEEEKKILPLYDNIQVVKRNLENIQKLLRTELQNAQGFQIDFIPQYEIGNQKNIPKLVHDSIERYQIAVKDLLIKSNYDLIGWESSALDTMTHQRYEQELLSMWREVNPNFTVNTPYIFEWFSSQYMWQDGVLAYWAMYPQENLVGTQEASLWKLNLKANSYDVHFSNKVAEFRSYVAMAKMIRKMRAEKSKQPIHAVIVMGAWHQTDITMIGNILGIKMNVISVSID
ncbi:MAG TPA: hypothetical protein VJY62_09140 [Bacteroidia bacterium]|nr:hypothetical protein [Bacteroidia bacterium]